MTAWILAAVLANVGAPMPHDSPTSDDKGAPQISGFAGNNELGSIWVFSGQVTDPDSNPGGTTVYFYGVLSGHTALVRDDGSFVLAAQLGSTTGAAGAQTEDVDGNKSNIAVTYVR